MDKRFLILKDQVWHEIILTNDLVQDLKKIYSILQVENTPTFVKYEKWSGNEKETALCEEYVIEYGVFSEEKPA